MRRLLLISLIIILLTAIVSLSGCVEINFNTGSTTKDITKSDSASSESGTVKQTSEQKEQQESTDEQGLEEQQKPEENLEEKDDAEEPAQSETYEVTSIVDGDTIVIGTGDKVRLIGINTPEDGEKCSEDAFGELETMILHERVRLERDVSDKDDYGRLLRYVYFDELFVNMEMVKQGLAIAYPYGNDIKYEVEFKAAEAEAKTSGGCIWETSSACSIEVSNIHADAAGNENDNLNDEYVTFKNTGSSGCMMAGWMVADNSASHRYTFPEFELDSEKEVTLYTGKGTDTDTALYWGRSSAVWNNDGDTVYLRDTNSDLVVSRSY